MKAIIEVTDCRDCPFAKEHRGHGECWTYCSHKDSVRKGYETILFGCHDQFKQIPEWCSLKEKEK